MFPNVRGDEVLCLSFWPVETTMHHLWGRSLLRRYNLRRECMLWEPPNPFRWGQISWRHRDLWRVVELSQAIDSSLVEDWEFVHSLKALSIIKQNRQVLGVVFVGCEILDRWGKRQPLYHMRVTIIKHVLEIIKHKNQGKNANITF